MDTTTTTALEALASVREYAASKRAATKAVMISPEYTQYIPEDQAHIQGFAEAMAFVASEVQRMIDALNMPQLVTAPAPILIFSTAAFARTDLATTTQAALGIEAYALHIPNIFDPAGPKDIQGWVCSPRMAHPQYVGYAIESDGATALQRLEARIGQFASDIEEDLAPPSPPPAAPAAPKRRAGKKTVRSARKQLGCQCPACLRTAPPASGVYGCRVGLEYHIYAAPDNYLGSRNDYGEAVATLSDYRTEGRRAA